MNEIQQRQIQGFLARDYSFSVSDFLRKGWEIYKQNAGGFIGFLFLYVLISLVANIIPVIGALANSLVISPALFAGFYIVSHIINTNEPNNFGDFFKGFEHWVQLMLMTLVMILIYIVVLSPSIYVFMQSGIVEWYMQVLSNPFDPPSEVPPVDAKTVGIFFLNMIPLLYLSIAYLWAPMFIVFYRMPFWDALETSRKMISRKWFSMFGLILSFVGLFILVYIPAILLAIMVPILGIILIVVVVIAAICLAPVIYTAIYASFAEATGLLEKEGENGSGDDILDHLVEDL
ncbi:MAG TPA: hypothetical protein PKA00_13655 [Saprospiraceae bacterium]|nr:hypothetical protein [Saprospiraceae bacterium]HMQ83956.1 hypothetical protein [Saprospiraceae bacterium]